jgi:hypothetical protein
VEDLFESLTSTEERNDKRWVDMGEKADVLAKGLDEELEDTDERKLHHPRIRKKRSMCTFILFLCAMSTLILVTAYRVVHSEDESSIDSEDEPITVHGGQDAEVVELIDGKNANKSWPFCLHLVNRKSSGFNGVSHIHGGHNYRSNC